MRGRAIGGLAGIVMAAVACGPAGPPEPHRGLVPESLREDALRSARVWRMPAVPIRDADLSRNPAAWPGFDPDRDVTCEFVETPPSGTTPKFSCRLPDGVILKVKYGRANPEGPAEVAATRLLAALGFGADRMFVVPAVRCVGCPPRPYESLRCLEAIGWRPLCLAARSGTTEFAAATVEQRIEGTAIEAYEGQGWAWYELERIDEAQGGSARAEVDALRLLAVFLAHWDNKAPNQRLVCPPGHERPDRACAAPFAIVQDLGATFGPLKLDLVNWRTTAVWSDPAHCEVGMRSLPFAGATFPTGRISEGGRRLLLGWLEQLSGDQLRDLFVSSGVTALDHVTADARDPFAWVRAFRDKVQEIADAGPCPQ